MAGHNRTLMAFTINGSKRRPGALLAFYGSLRDPNESGSKNEAFAGEAHSSKGLEWLKKPDSPDSQNKPYGTIVFRLIGIG